MPEPIFIGIDVGTQGARVVACDAVGKLIASAEEPFAFAPPGALPDGWHEQDPRAWWDAAARCLRAVSSQLSADAVQAISVTSTSGTVCFLDEKNQPLGPAIMYNDRRAEAEGKELNAALSETAERMGYRFNSSYALAKILWVKRHQPQLFAQTRRILHAADYLIGRLSGDFGVSDYTNALKTGFDLIDERWPGEIQSALEIPIALLPRIGPPGALVGELTAACAEEIGLRAGIPIAAGMTDGCASQVSTGAVSPGEWNSTLGTTLVIKGVTRQILKDSLGRVYSHKHPDGFWLPGGASNTGGECLPKRFAGADWDALNQRATELTPTGRVVYPLCATGERFPFVNASAEGFELGDGDEAVRYTSYLEGVGYVERLAYQVLEELGASVGERVFIAGGGNKSAAWCQIRASILNRTLAQPRHTGGAVGAAILAASRTHFDGIIPASRAMVTLDRTYEPQPSPRYDDAYQQLVAECRRRGYFES